MSYGSANAPLRNNLRCMCCTAEATTPTQNIRVFVAAHRDEMRKYPVVESFPLQDLVTVFFTRYFRVYRIQVTTNHKECCPAGVRVEENATSLTNDASLLRCGKAKDLSLQPKSR